MPTSSMSPPPPSPTTSSSRGAQLPATSSPTAAAASTVHATRRGSPSPPLFPQRPAAGSPPLPLPPGPSPPTPRAVRAPSPALPPPAAHAPSSPPSLPPPLPSAPPAVDAGVLDPPAHTHSASKDLAYLESVERTLVESIERLSRKLGESRAALAGPAPARGRYAARRPRGTPPLGPPLAAAAANTLTATAPTNAPQPTIPRHPLRRHASSLGVSPPREHSAAPQARQPASAPLPLPPRAASPAPAPLGPSQYASLPRRASTSALSSSSLEAAQLQHQLHQEHSLGSAVSAAADGSALPVSPSDRRTPPPPPPLRQRVITVSLHLPTKANRESAQQQFCDARLPPKGMFALEKASDLPFVWVGAPDPAIMSPLGTGNLAAFEEIYGSSRTTSRMLEDPFDAVTHPHVSHIVPVTLPKEPQVMEAFHAYCDRTLYHLLHYDYSSLASDEDMGDAERYWTAYRDVNQRFAEAVSEIYEEGDLIWVHNYHLMLVPNMLRRRLWFAKIGFFLYSPFPSAELFRILPNRVDILSGVVGSDLVGFHTYDYSKQFAASCTRLLGVESSPKGIQVEPRSARVCEFGIYPAGIDVRDLKLRVSSNKVAERIASLRRRFGDRKVIVGIDRLDDAFAGIPLKLLAFERFLADNESWRGRVLLVQVATLPKQEGPKGRLPHRVQINEFVARINSLYGTFAFSPVHYINEELDSVDILALMCVGHVCMISVTRDGFGLVPYEWTVCQHGGNKGCIILSEFAGAAPSFATALHVNPWDVDDVGEKVLMALEMSESERAMRHASAYTFVTTHTASLWGLNFLEDLEQANSCAEAPGAMSAPTLDPQIVMDAFFHRSPSRNSSSASLVSMHGQSRKASSLGSGTARTPKPLSPVQSMTSAAGGALPSPPPMRTARVSPSHSQAVSSTSSLSGRRGPSSSPVPVAGNPSLVPSGSPAPSPYLPIRRRAPKKKKVFVLDYDGTLVASQAIAEHVAPSPQVLQLLKDLCNLENTFVVLLSGRDRNTLTHWFGDLDLFLGAEDGSFLRYPGDSDWVALFRRTAADDYGVRSHHGDGYTAPPTPVPPGSLSSSGAAEKVSAALASIVTASADSGGHGNNAGKQIEDSGYPASVMSPCNTMPHDPVMSEGGLDEGLAAAVSAGAADGSVAENYVHPLLAGSARHRGSMSSMGSQGADSGNVPEWKEQVMPIMQHFAERTPGVILEEGDATLTWHFNDADTEFGRLQARDLQKQLESFLLQKFSIEVIAEEGSSRYPTRWVKVRPAGVDKAVVIERALEWIRDDVAASSASGSANSVNLMGSGASSMSTAFAASVLKAARDVGSSSGLDMDGANLSTTNMSGSNERSPIDFIFVAGDDRADDGMFSALNDSSKLDAMGLASLSTRIFTCRIGAGSRSASAVLESPQKLVEMLEDICRRQSESLNCGAAVPQSLGTALGSSGGQPFSITRSQNHPGSW